MRGECVSSDIIKAIFHYLGAHKRFPANVPKIHKVFYVLSQDEKYSKLFSGFVFDTSKIFPYGITIRYALDRLQKANLLACINPGLDEFEISEALSNWKLEDSNLFDATEITLLKDAAKEFDKLVAV